MGESEKDAWRVNFDRKLKLEFHGVKVTSDAALLGPGYSDENYSNNRTYKTTSVGIFTTVSAQPRLATDGDVVEITVDSRETLPSDMLDSIIVEDSAGNPISLDPCSPEHQPGSTQWIYETVALPTQTALGRTYIEVSGTDANGFTHYGYGYFNMIDVLPDFYLNSCDIKPSELNPDIGEEVTIEAVVHADSDNAESTSDIPIPVSFYAEHPSGNTYKIGDTQYTEGISPGDSNSVYTPWQNAAEGVYIIEVELGPGFSDDHIYNNQSTRSIVVGDLPFDAVFDVNNRTRVSRTIFDYECNITLNNQSPLTIDNIHLELTDTPNNISVSDAYVLDFPVVNGNGISTSQDTCTIRVDRTGEINSAELDWQITYDVVNTCQTAQQTSTSTIQLDTVTGDITGNGVVDIDDLMLLANQWLQQPETPSADIAPQPNGDNFVDFKDFASLAENWMK